MTRGVRNFFCAAVALAAILAWSAPAWAQGTVTGDKTVAPADVACDGAATVTVTLDAMTGLAGNPADIELVLDRSGSMGTMGGAPLAALKSAASTFVDIIDEATDGVLDGTIANGSRVGVVSFDQNATVDVPLTADANAVKAAINALVAVGGTNHQAAIVNAQAELAGSMPASAKTMIIFTDGQTTAGGNGQPEAAAARGAGTEIFAIGLGSVNVGQLNGWATDPDSEHVFITPAPGDLDAIFQAIGAAITVPAATGVSVVDTISSHFAVSGAVASKGAVAQAGNVLTWTMPELGTETVTLTYTVTHDATLAGGPEALNDSTVYSDAEGKAVAFPSPVLNVRGCPAAISLAPAAAENELGTPGQGHAVTATVSDDFGDPVAGVSVSFDVLSGPNAAAPNGSDTTDGTGEAAYAYTAVQGPAGLGTDTIEACFTNGQGAEVCDSATKLWQDTTAPEVACDEGTNPAGETVPGEAAGGGGNPDGFFVLTATDAVDPDPQIFITDSADAGVVFGPFASGTTIKLTQAPGATQSIKPGSGAIDWKVKLKGDALVTATDGSGNVGGPASCMVPPS